MKRAGMIEMALWGLGVLAVAAASFLATLWLINKGPVPVATGAGSAGGPISFSLKFDKGETASSALVQGWRVGRDGFATMTGQRALVVAHVDGAASGATRLTIAAKADLAGGEASRTVALVVNDHRLGNLEFTRSGEVAQRDYQIPAEVFNRYTPLFIAFESTQPTNAFALSALRLGDVRALPSAFEGYIDHCSATRIDGWAKSGNAPARVTIQRNGERIATLTPNVLRPDLAAAGHPAEAGFTFTPATPFASGDTVDVQFSNGAPLKRSPCKVP